MDPATNNSDAAVAAEVEKVRRLLADGQWFLAYDAARDALAKHPGQLKLLQMSARALIPLGAIDEARRILEPLCPRLDGGNADFAALLGSAQTAAEFLLRGDRHTTPSPQVLESFADLLEKLVRVRDAGAAGFAGDEETLGLLARVYKDTFRESGRIEDARRCRDMYLRAYRKTGGYWTGINAATMSWMLARSLESAGQAEAAKVELDEARALAARAAQGCAAALPAARGDERFWVLATLGEARLHLGDAAGAVEAYRSAMGSGPVGGTVVASARQQLQFLQSRGFSLPAGLLDVLKLPAVVVFSGHMIDAPGRPAPRFPHELEPAAREMIHAALDELGARVGYSSGACGGDLLFIEALQDREAEANIVLPFDAEDFVQTSVLFAGPAWVRRFRRAVKLAGPLVSYATPEKYMGTVELFRYADQIIHSLAYLRARSLGGEPWLVALYDGKSPVGNGGTADVISRWPDRGRMRVLVLPEGRSNAAAMRQAVAARVPPAASSAGGVPEGSAAPVSPALELSHASVASPAPASHPAPGSSAIPVSSVAPEGARRVIRTMLFADVVGFSKLQEEHVPYFLYEFLKVVSAELSKLPERPLMVNTWGDAIFAVMREALPMVEYARTLHAAVCGTDWSKLNLPAEMSVRIGLHAGPVFEGIDAITGRPNFFGSHVNRAARIEPVTLPGHIYASQQFVGQLTAEQRNAGEPPGGWPFTCEYLGTLSLAKNFGLLPVYHVRERYGR